MARFDQYRRRLHAHTDGMFARRVLLTFFNEGRQDPERPPQEIYAPLIIGNREDHNLAGDGSNDWVTDIRTGGAELKINRARYPDIQIEKGDTVTMLDLPGQPKFRVAAVDGSGHGRVIVRLGDTQ